MADNQEQNYQPEQTGMYELEFPAPQLSSSDGRGPVMIHALEGFSDAGHAIRLAAQHLKNTLDTELVASFAIDELLDYRSRRPLMTFKTDHFTHYEDPELNLYALHDSVGTPFLLLAGMEPDLRWERFITAVRLLAERLGVRRVIGLGTIPMAVPHTRPVTLTAHSNDKELIADHQPWVGEVQVPGSVSNLLEFRMAQHGHEVVGFTVHVPHYLAQTDYPPAAEALLAEVAKSGSLQIPLTALDEAGAEVHAKINEQVEASTEVAQVVTALERQYDAFVAAQENRSLLARDEDLPSGDELGAEFERFLAQQAGDKFKKAPKKAKTATSSPHRPDNEVGEMTQRKPNLRPVRELTPSLQFRTIHGYRRAFRVAGSGPAILLIHGIGDNSTTWSTVQSKLAQRFTVIAPDLLGHGKSDKPRADYSVAAYANGMRDLLSVLDIDRVTVIGHSLGGGVAMQFAYQFPQLVDRLILVGAGGVTKDVNIALRWASLPMGSEALALLRLPLVLPVLQVVGRVAGALFGFHGLGPRPARRAAHPGRPARADRVVGVRPDLARRGGLARPGRHHAGPMLFDRIRSRAIDLGRTGIR